MPENYQKIRMLIREGNYECIGSGSARKVYDLNNGYVAKVAKNKKGYAQNSVEWEICQQENTFLLAKAVYLTEDSSVLFMEKAEKIGSHKKLMQDIHKWSKKYPYNSEIAKLQDNYGLVGGDLARTSSWGIIKGKPVLVDYGFSSEVRKKYYRRGFF